MVSSKMDISSSDKSSMVSNIDDESGNASNFNALPGLGTERNGHEILRQMSEMQRYSFLNHLRNYSLRSRQTTCSVNSKIPISSDDDDKYAVTDLITNMNSSDRYAIDDVISASSSLKLTKSTGSSDYRHSDRRDNASRVPINDQLLDETQDTTRRFSDSNNGMQNEHHPAEKANIKIIIQKKSSETEETLISSSESGDFAEGGNETKWHSSKITKAELLEGKHSSVEVYASPRLSCNSDGAGNAEARCKINTSTPEAKKTRSILRRRSKRGTMEVPLNDKKRSSVHFRASSRSSGDFGGHDYGTMRRPSYTNTPNKKKTFSSSNNKPRRENDEASVNERRQHSEDGLSVSSKTKRHGKKKLRVFPRGEKLRRLFLARLNKLGSNALGQSAQNIAEEIVIQHHEGDTALPEECDSFNSNEIDEPSRAVVLPSSNPGKSSQIFSSPYDDDSSDEDSSDDDRSEDETLEEFQSSRMCYSAPCITPRNLNVSKVSLGSLEPSISTTITTRTTKDPSKSRRSSTWGSLDSNTLARSSSSAVRTSVEVSRGPRASKSDMVPGTLSKSSTKSSCVSRNSQLDLTASGRYDREKSMGSCSFSDRSEMDQSRSTSILSFHSEEEYDSEDETFREFDEEFFSRETINAFSTDDETMRTARTNSASFRDRHKSTLNSSAKDDDTKAESLIYNTSSQSYKTTGVIKNGGLKAFLCGAPVITDDDSAFDSTVSESSFADGSRR